MITLVVRLNVWAIICVVVWASVVQTTTPVVVWASVVQTTTRVVVWASVVQTTTLLSCTDFPGVCRDFSPSYALPSLQDTLLITYRIIDNKET
jgi:hypothetical protein